MPAPPAEPTPSLPSESRFFAPELAQDASYLAASARISSLVWRGADICSCEQSATVSNLQGQIVKDVPRWRHNVPLRFLANIGIAPKSDTSKGENGFLFQAQIQHRSDPC